MRSSTGTPATGLRPFPLARVRLRPGRWQAAQEGVRRYLRTEDLPARLLRQWHLLASVDTFVPPLGGPERPDIFRYRGDFVGHYLSACALMEASTGDETVRRHAQYVVGEVARCQQLLQADGFVAGYPETRLDAVERGQFVMVPYYALHKIMAGLLDQFTFCDNAAALDALVKLADYLARRLARLPDETWRKIVLPIEYGGMLELCLNLHAVTGNPEHFALAMKFDDRQFFDPLERGEDALTGHHANTNIPKVVGAARAYEVTGEPRWLAIAENFWRLFTGRRMYVCGGSDHAEMWFDPALMPRSLSPLNHEFCCVYNMLKLSRLLLRITGQPTYADYIERALVNTVLGFVRPEDGMVGGTMLPMTTGCRKNYSTPYDSFWCCMGTGIESGAKLGEGIFHHDERHSLLAVGDWIPARLEWAEREMVADLETPFPDGDRIRITLRGATPQRFTLQWRVPHWAQAPAASLNGEALEVPPPARGGESCAMSLTREWRNGDTLEFAAPMALNTEPLFGDDRLRAVRVGPIVLAGLVREDRFVKPASEADRRACPLPGGAVEDWGLDGHPDSIGKWLVPAEGAPLTFRTRGLGQDLAFVPLHRVTAEAYGIYWPVSACDPSRLDGLRRREEARVIDRVRIGDPESEAAHALDAGASELAYQAGWASRNGGSFSWRMKVKPDRPLTLAVTFFHAESGWRGFETRVEGVKLDALGMDRMPPCEFREREIPVPEELTRGKSEVQVSFHAPEASFRTGPIYGVAMLEGQGAT